MADRKKIKFKHRLLIISGSWTKAPESGGCERERRVSRCVNGRGEFHVVRVSRCVNGRGEFHVVHITTPQMCLVPLWRVRPLTELCNYTNK
uniref:Uncharacterized protein n=1 Tax=Cyclopterus lumpus TaxID=8103 RepID=A0A8C3AUG8_CYCLU